MTGILCSTLFSLSIFATNTISTRTHMMDSVRLYATRTTTTIPNNVNIDITVGGFLDINEFVFSIDFDASRLQLLGVDNNAVSAFSSANIDISHAGVGKIHWTWVGTPTTLVDLSA